MIPADQNTIWTITKTATTLKIGRDGVELLTYTFAEADSVNVNCVSFWSKDTHSLKFLKSTGPHVNARATYFRAKPGATLLKQNFIHYRI